MAMAYVAGGGGKKVGYYLIAWDNEAPVFLHSTTAKGSTPEDRAKLAGLLRVWADYWVEGDKPLD